MSKLFITDTILRDAHQSQAATRMRTDEMLAACEILDSIGYWSLECWGGATFDSCLRFLNEDPWERLRTLRKALPNTKLQMLFRGQNILGYKHYADDIVERFVRKAIENGIDVIRIFDALNDVRNLESSIKFTKKYGGICEAALSYTVSPVHSEDYFVDLAKQLVQMGADVICIKDMANLLLPYDAYSLVKRLKSEISVPIHLHTHNTAGTGDMTYLMAVQAGVDIVDCALSALGNGTSQPATEPLVASLKGTERDTGLDIEKLAKASRHFMGVAERLKKDDKENQDLKMQAEKSMRGRWDLVNMLCNEYFEKGDNEKLKAGIISKVDKEMERICSRKHMEEIETLVNNSMNGIVTKLRTQCPELKQEDVLFATLVYAGLAPRAVCLCTGIKLKYYYTKRMRLVERINRTDAPNKELFISKLWHDTDKDPISVQKREEEEKE